MTATHLDETIVPYSPPRTVRSNGIELCYDTFGPPTAEPLLLIMGLGCQMIQWDDEFCSKLAARGFWVIRFDNRDVGKSTHLGGGRVRLRWSELIMFRLFGTPVAAPYKLHDMASDVLGLLDALEIDKAHVVGVSMGGMIAQELAISSQERVRSLTSIMSTTGNPRLPPPTAEVAALLTRAPARTRDEYVAQFLVTWKMLRVGAFPLDEAKDRERAERIYERGHDPAGYGRQLRAILASGNRKKRLGAVTAPTLVLHGALDPLIRPEAGRDTAAAIPGAKLQMLEGMGHALPISMWPTILDAIADHAYAASASAPNRG